MGLHFEVDGQVGLLRFDHGKANEMGAAELAEFEALAGRLEGGEVRALITWSERRSRRDTPIFVAGANVTERRGWGRAQVEAHVRRQRALMARWRRLPLLHVCVVHGVALGWGTEYLLTADWRIATPGAVFGLPETGLGILPGAGGTAELAAVVGIAHALRLGMTGDRIGAEEAVRIGLVQAVAPDLAAGLEQARELAGRVARNSPTAVAAFKRALLAAWGRPGPERQEIEARAYEHCVATGQAAIGREHFEAIRRGEPVDWGSLVPFEP